MRRILVIALVLAAASFAQDETYIRNICDTLAGNVDLQLIQLEEIRWYGSKNLSRADSVRKSVYEDYREAVPFKDKFFAKLPVSVSAGCAAGYEQAFRYATWANSAWVLADDKYSTLIMDVNQFSIGDYNPSNAFNILVFKSNGSLLDEPYLDNELMVSKTFELKFDWWYSLAIYQTDVVRNDGAVGVRYNFASSAAMDSLTAVTKSVSDLGVPDSISKVQLQVFHGVLVNLKENQPESSSSEEFSSSQQEMSSSSEGTTAIGRLDRIPQTFNGSREVRRLDGSVVKAGAAFKPGVYYVKGLNGRWKKQVELPR